MQAGMSRFTQVGDWLFEVKMVRALRVQEFGQPYSAFASITVNGDNLYIDSQMTRLNEDFNRDDYMSFYEFCKQLDAKEVHYDKVRRGRRQPRIVAIEENQKPLAKIQLVR